MKTKLTTLLLVASTVLVFAQKKKMELSILTIQLST